MSASRAMSPMRARMGGSLSSGSHALANISAARAPLEIASASWPSMRAVPPAMIARSTGPGRDAMSG